MFSSFAKVTTVCQNNLSLYLSIDWPTMAERRGAYDDQSNCTLNVHKRVSLWSYKRTLCVWGKTFYNTPITHGGPSRSSDVSNFLWRYYSTMVWLAVYINRSSWSTLKIITWHHRRPALVYMALLRFTTMYRCSIADCKYLKVFVCDYPL